MNDKITRLPGLMLSIAICLFAGCAHGTDALHQRVDSLFSEWSKPDSPGAVVGVIQRGEWAYQQAYGLASGIGRCPITPATTVSWMSF